MSIASHRYYFTIVKIQNVWIWYSLNIDNIIISLARPNSISRVSKLSLNKLNQRWYEGYVTEDSSPKFSNVTINKKHDLSITPCIYDFPQSFTSTSYNVDLQCMSENSRRVTHAWLLLKELYQKTMYRGAPTFTFAKSASRLVQYIFTKQTKVGSNHYITK